MIRPRFLWLFAVSLTSCVTAQDSSPPPTVSQVTQFVTANCLDCHSGESGQGGLDLDAILDASVAANQSTWERVARKLSARQMPPDIDDRPPERSYREVLAELTRKLDAASAEAPNPGRTESLRRLTRTEYRNAIRDLLALDVDVTKWLPRDESSHGFDNITVTELSPTLLNRYVTAAQSISRLAVGRTGRIPASDTFRVRPDITQDHQRVPGLPLGTRGGTLIRYNFPQDGEYVIQVWLMRDRNDEIEGLKGTHELEVLLDRDKVASFRIEKPKGKSDRSVDANLQTRLSVTAGAHDVGVTFVGKPFSLLESKRQPLNVHYNFYRHPRLAPAVYQVSITGPFDATGPGDTASRKRIFGAVTSPSNQSETGAEQILSRLMRHAYRRPIDQNDLREPMEFFKQGLAEEGDFDAGIERAIAAILVNPHFLFRIERDPPPVQPTTTVAKPIGTSSVYRVSDLELATRLSFFLWSSLPDEELLEIAARNQLRRPDILEQQVRRMLADERSHSLVTSFADQWLYLRNLDSITPDGRLFPDFGHNLRTALRRETELLFEDVLREDRSVLALVDSPYTWLNERLATHYGIPHVVGSRFRRVTLPPEVPRGGILRHGSVLMVTSYATRTSPVIRGKWILENILGTPPAPPPANVPALEDNTVAADLPVRERLAAHRANAACAVCHDTIDPVGFALENFDAVGRWRTLELGKPVDASGGLPDGTRFEGVRGLEQALLKRPELFVQTLTEKLLTFALGRGLEYYDAPAIRRIIRDAEQDNYRLSALVTGIVQSVPFQMRTAAQPVK